MSDEHMVVRPATAGAARNSPALRAAYSQVRRATAFGADHVGVQPGPRGFTLLEVLVAVLITAVIMVAVSTTLVSTMRARNQVGNLTESTEAGSRILNLLERDLRGLWTHNIKENRVLIGRNMDIASASSDRLDFLTHTDSISSIETTDEKLAHATICEVGYWLKTNPKDDLLMELWRREDPMVDDDLQRGGTFQKIHDRVRSFNITYFKTLGKNSEEFHDWDSSTESTLPRVIKIEFTIERKLPAKASRSDEIEDFESNSKKYTRYIVLDKEIMVSLQASSALIPVLPNQPTKEQKSGEPEGGGGPMGGGGGGGGAKGGGGRADVLAKGKGGLGGEMSFRGGERGGQRGGNRGRGPATTQTGFGNQLPPNFFQRGQGSGNFDLNRFMNQMGGGGRLGGR